MANFEIVEPGAIVERKNAENLFVHHKYGKPDNHHKKEGSPMAQWINFKELREKLNFPRVLDEYNVQLNAKGDQAIGFCPLTTHKGEKRSQSFSVNLTRGIFQCFGCKAKGNVLDFACQMEGFDLNDKADFRKAALRVSERFGITASQSKKESETPKPPGAAQPKEEKKTGPTRQVNAPLDFTLKGLDRKHLSLLNRGLTQKTIEDFGLGYCGRGLMKGRVAIPLHNQKGEFIGYAGRLIDDSAITDEQPKYKFPGERKRDEVVYEFKKTLFVYNGHRVQGPAGNLIVVEGFPAVWWLSQAGYSHVVGLMGSSCSDEQADIIKNLVSPGGRLWFFPDGDPAGEHCAIDLLTKLSPFRFVRWIKLESGRQPTDCGPQELATLFNKKQQ
jgi:DNA primase